MILEWTAIALVALLIGGGWLAYRSRSRRPRMLRESTPQAQRTTAARARSVVRCSFCGRTSPTGNYKHYRNYGIYWCESCVAAGYGIVTQGFAQPSDVDDYVPPCDHCGFRFLRATSTFRNGRQSFFYITTCPECGKENRPPSLAGHQKFNGTLTEMVDFCKS